MELIIKNKLFSLAKNSIVTNEENEVFFKVKGNVLSNIITHSHKKVIKDKNGKKLFVVRRKFWHPPFHDRTLIIRKHKVIATLMDCISGLKIKSYELVGTSEPMKLEGSTYDMNIYLGGKKIGHIGRFTNNVAREFVRLTDVFRLTYENEEDASFLVALVIALDITKDNR